MKFNAHFKKTIKHNFPNFIENYRVLKSNVNFNKKYWEEHLNKVYDSIDNLELNPYDKIRLKKYPENHTDRKHAVVEINNTCNLNCAMCQTMSATRKRGRMDLELFKKILGKLSKKGIETIALHTLGDPLANPRLPEIFREIRNFGLKTSICTNGLLLDKHVKTLIEYMDICPSISFSIDGAKSETYEKIRIGGNFDNLITQLELSNKELRSKGMSVKIQYMICNDNLDQIGDFICKFRKYVLIPEHDISFAVITGLAPDNTYFNKANPFPNLTHKNLMCFRPAGDPLWFNVDGTVSACCRDYHGDLIVGDIINQNFDEIITGKPLKKLQEAHESGNLSKFPLCDSCYRPDKRIDGIMSSLIRFLIFLEPNGDAYFYQKNVDKIISIFQSNSNFSDKIKTVISNLN